MRALGSQSIKNAVCLFMASPNPVDTTKKEKLNS